MHTCIYTCTYIYCVYLWLSSCVYSSLHLDQIFDDLQCVLCRSQVHRRDTVGIYMYVYTPIYIHTCAYIYIYCVCVWLSVFVYSYLHLDPICNHLKCVLSRSHVHRRRAVGSCMYIYLLIYIHAHVHILTVYVCGFQWLCIHLCTSIKYRMT